MNVIKIIIHSYLPVRCAAAGHPKNKFALMEKAFGLANAAIYDYGVRYPDGSARMEPGLIHRRRG